MTERDVTRLVAAIAKTDHSKRKESRTKLRRVRERHPLHFVNFDGHYCYRDREPGFIQSRINQRRNPGLEGRPSIVRAIGEILFHPLRGLKSRAEREADLAVLRALVKLQWTRPQPPSEPST